jgi:hypothetical protein
MAAASLGNSLVDRQWIRDGTCNATSAWIVGSYRWRHRKHVDPKIARRDESGVSICCNTRHCGLRRASQIASIVPGA